MDSLAASTQGLNLVDQKRQQKRWNKTSTLWCQEAFTTRSTLNRFWEGKPIRRETFIAICEAVGVGWEQVAVQPNNLSEDFQSFSLPFKIAPIKYWVGRNSELDTLKQLLLDSHTRTVTITSVSVVGLAGVGKTTLASQLVRQMQSENAPFVVATWESLRSTKGIAPRFDTIIDAMLFDLSFGQIGAADIILEDYLQKTERLVQLLKKQRCLVVMDNVETVLSSKKAQKAGYFADECAEYAWLFKQLAETEHQSKVIFTSRETLAELPRLQTHTFQLGGLDLKASVDLLQALNLTGTSTEFSALARRYDGHPKALELVAAVINEDFQGEISRFLADRKWLLIRDLESLIDEIIVRLSQEEYTCLSQISVYQTSEFPLLSSGIAAQMSEVTERHLKENIILALKRRQLLDYDSESKLCFGDFGTSLQYFCFD
ncbi:MAG: ATP-binding protein [Phormidium sp.]